MRNRTPSGASTENPLPRPSTTSTVRCVCFQPDEKILGGGCERDPLRHQKKPSAFGEQLTSMFLICW